MSPAARCRINPPPSRAAHRRHNHNNKDRRSQHRWHICHNCHQHRQWRAHRLDRVRDGDEHKEWNSILDNVKVFKDKNTIKLSSNVANSRHPRAIFRHWANHCRCCHRLHTASHHRTRTTNAAAATSTTFFFHHRHRCIIANQSKQFAVDAASNAIRANRCCCASNYRSSCNPRQQTFTM